MFLSPSSRARPRIRAAVSIVTSSGRLTYTSATALKFAPFAGNTIKINGIVYQIPSGGIAGLGNPNSVFRNGSPALTLAASTVYFVYVFNNSGTLTADFSTTTHATSTTAGNVGTEIKSGDDTRSLVGMIITNGSSQYQVAPLILSWFNRQMLSSTTGVGGGSTASTTLVALASTVSSLSWGDDSLQVLGVCELSTTGSFAQLEIGIDGTSTLFGAFAYSYSSTPAPMTIGGQQSISEGYHSYGYWGGAASGSGTATLNNGFINVSVRG